jgi:hypothetical protein
MEQQQFRRLFAVQKRVPMLVHAESGLIIGCVN